MDLVEFLRARLDEDEQAARHASIGPWVPRAGYICGGPEGAVHVAQQAQSWNAEHIARHDPTRVLREVEAKRRIIALGESTLVDAGQAYEAWEQIVQHLALPYADHADYQAEWKL